ncbi:hypothetical protein [Paremcibacter congregatus]|uniref:hypothetical protein n=1 Tax=Paremcibacter congregatus TaxID=2043170 RepID=UPI003A8FD202
MPKFLRDEHLKNYRFDNNALAQINNFLLEKQVQYNANVNAAANGDDVLNDLLLLSYVIRFDGKGYKLDSFAEFERYYNDADNVERVIFILDTNRSEATNRNYGTHFEVRLDVNDMSNSYIQVAADDSNVVDLGFFGITEILEKHKSMSYIVQNTWFQLLVQVLGVAFGFVLSFIAAVNLSPHIKIENSFVISFIFTFLIFSNIWGFLSAQIYRLLNYTFPNIRFHRQGKGTLHWLAQGLIGGIFVALTLMLTAKLADWIGQTLQSYIAN